jgi:hypothetical protein
MNKLVKADSSNAVLRRVYFDIRLSADGISPSIDQGGSQPQISVNGGSWTNTGIGTLTHIGNGRYYADLTQSIISTVGDQIQTRYKGATTVETPGDSYQVVAFDLNVSVVTLSSSSLDSINTILNTIISNSKAADVFQNLKNEEIHQAK